MKTMTAIGTINKAWAAAIAAPLADWMVGVLADKLIDVEILMPEAAHVALVSLIVGLVVYRVPNLTNAPPQ